MYPRTPLPRVALAAIAFSALAAACGGSSSSSSGPIVAGEGVDIAGAPGWKWIAFDDAYCTDMTSPGVFSKGKTGLAVSWGTGNDLVVFLQGGGACWDFVTCGGLATYYSGTPTALTGPFGPAQFAADIYAKYPSSWIRRDQMPAAIATATVVFVPYCTGDVHSGDRATTYASPGLPSITWYHLGHANMEAFLRRLGPAFKLGPTDKLVVAGSSGGGFGSLANYESIRATWPEPKGYLVDDSGPPFIGDDIPLASRTAWYLEWNMAASLGSWCPECPTDVSKGLAHILANHPADRVALLSHTQDEVIRDFFGTFTTTYPYFQAMDATTFQTDLTALGTTVLDTGSTNGRYFFTASPTPTAHPTLEDPTQVTTPAPGVAAWMQEMLSDDAAWVSVADP